MATAVALPEGFVLDTPADQVKETVAPPAALPEGFVLDSAEATVDPTMETPVQETEEVGVIGELGQNISQFGEDLSSTFETAGDNFIRMRDDWAAGKIGDNEAALELLSDVGIETLFGAVGDILSLAGRNVATVTPEEIANPIKETASSAMYAILDTPVGQAGIEALQAGGDLWADFEESNPRAARNIGNIVNVGLVLAPVPGAGAAKSGTKAAIRSAPTAAEKAGGEFILKQAGKLDAAANAQTLRQRLDFAENLVRPEQTKRQLQDQALRTGEGGLFTTGRIEATEAEKAIVDAVAALDKVSPSNTMRTNAKIIQQENIAEAKALENLLNSKPILVPKAEFRAAMEGAQLRLAENPLLVGDSARTAQKVVDKMNSLIEKNKSTVGGILKSRKELDAWVKSQRPKVFDSASESALTSSVKEIRNTTNQFLDDIVPDGAVKRSLNKQSNLFRALDNMGPKVAAESTNKMVRLWQNVSKLTPFKSKLNAELATGLGIVGLGSALTQLTPAIGGLAATGGALYLGGRAAMSPTTKRALSALLRKTDEALKGAKKAGSPEELVTKIRADRAALVEILRDVEVIEEPEA